MIDQAFECLTAEMFVIVRIQTARGVISRVPRVDQKNAALNAAVIASGLI